MRTHEPTDDIEMSESMSLSELSEFHEAPRANGVSGIDMDAIERIFTGYPIAPTVEEYEDKEEDQGSSSSSTWNSEFPSVFDFLEVPEISNIAELPPFEEAVSFAIASTPGSPAGPSRAIFSKVQKQLRNTPISSCPRKSTISSSIFSRVKFPTRTIHLDNSTSGDADSARAEKIKEQERKIALQEQELLNQEVKLERLQKRVELLDAVKDKQEAHLLSQELKMVRLERRASLLDAVNGTWVGSFLVVNICYCVWHVTKCFARHIDKA